MIPYPLQEKFSPLVGYTEGKQLRQRWDFIFLSFTFRISFPYNFFNSKKKKKERKKEEKH